MDRSGALLIVFGDDLGASFPLGLDAAAQWVVGRGSQADILVTGEGISRAHCVVRADAQAMLHRLRDSSRNGTYVNGERAVGDVVLEPGDHIQLGRLIFKYASRDDLTHTIYNRFL